MSNSQIKDNTYDNDIEILDLFIDQHYSEISDIHYELKNECDELCNGLFYHSADFDFINLLRNHIIVNKNDDNNSDSDDDNCEISDI